MFKKNRIILVSMAITICIALITACNPDTNQETLSSSETQSGKIKTHGRDRDHQFDDGEQQQERKENNGIQQDKQNHQNPFQWGGQEIEHGHDLCRFRF